MPKRKLKYHPAQQVVRDPHGTARFRENAIVTHLLDNSGIDMNDLAVLPFSQEDRIQFAQLIGYSVRGFETLSYVTDRAAESASSRLDTLVRKEVANAGREGDQS